MGQRIRVLIVDDHGLMRQGLVAMLGDVEDIEIIGTADSGESAVNKNQRTGKLTDAKLTTRTNIYEYRLIIPTLCKQEYSSLLHNSIRLTVEKDETSEVEKMNLVYNEYKNWQKGVDHYELWQQVDSAEYILLSNPESSPYIIEYNNVGFDYCFKVKAIENGGNNISWSNATCVNFVPHVTLYNVITVNDDLKNDTFFIEGIENYPNNSFTVFNRYGSPVFKATGYHNTWSGTDTEGKELSTGVYFYLLNLNDSRPKNKIYKGDVSIVR